MLFISFHPLIDIEIFSASFKLCLLYFIYEKICVFNLIFDAF